MARGSHVDARASTERQLARPALNVCYGEPVEETRRRLDERPGILNGESVGEALLKTHVPYNRLIAPVMAKIHGIAHITGGGYVENVPRILPDGLNAIFDTRSWPVLPIFRLIQQRGEINAEEMYEVFNMGLGLVLMIDKRDADEVLAAVPGSLRVGAITASGTKRVELRGL